MSDILKALLITILFFVGIGIIILICYFICYLCKLYPDLMMWIGLGIGIILVVLFVFGVVYFMITGGF